MARKIRRYGPYLIMFAILVGITALLVPTPDPVEAATYVDPWWTNDSPSPECAGCTGCGCPRPSEWSLEGVSNRTGSLVRGINLFTTPGMVSRNVYSLLWSSDVDGATQMGNGMILSVENTVEENIINALDPDSAGGTEVYWRRPDRTVVTFVSDGSGGFETTDCSIRHVLTHNSPYKLTDEHGNEMLFDANGMPDKYTDRNGNVTDFTYNSSYQMTGLVDDRGKSYTIDHNTDGYMASIEDPAGRKWEFGYDTNGNLVTIDTPNTTDQPTGITTTINYDGSNRITGVEDGRGNEVTTYTWVGSTSQIDKVTIDLDDVDFTYAAGLTTRTDRNGNVHRTHYSGQDITKTDMLVSAAAKYATEYTYSGGILVRLVKPRGNRVEFVYDGSGNLLSRRHKTTDTATDNAADLLHEWAYTNNFVTSYTDSEGHETTYTRDTDGNVTVVNYPDVTSPVSQTSVTKAIEYNAYGQVTKVTDEEGKIVQRAYFGVGDDFGLLQKVEVDPTGLDLETTYTYDAAWNVATVTDPLAKATTYTWDNLRRLKQAQAPSPVSRKIKNEYDANGNRTKNEVENLDKDGDSVTANPWITTTYTYTVQNQPLDSHKDDAANLTSWAFDALDRPTEMEYPNLKTVAYEYDDNNNVTEVVDAAGNDIDSVYDDNNRRTSRSITLATGFLGTTSETFTYDGLGRMTKAEDNDYKVEFTHGVIGLSYQVYEEKQSYVGGTAYLKTVKKTYDAVGNKVTELYPSNLDLDYTWNDISRLATVTDGTNTIATYSYYGHRTKDVQFESGATATYNYTGFRSGVDSIHHLTSTPTTIIDLQYGYNDNHDRLYERFGGGSSVGDAFEYDKARRLTTAWMGSADVTAASSSVYVSKVEYVMDDDGNRTSVKVTPYGQSQATTSYTDNNLNQYTVVGGTNQTHDDNGNLTDNGTQQYEYDYRSQIVRVKQSSTTIAEYKYDALGRRVDKDDQADVERYIYSAAETVSVYDGSNVWVRDFVFGSRMDEVLMLEQADVLDFDSDSNTTETTRSFYHTNALGSVMSITDMNQAEVANYRYDPYGNVTITRNSTTQSSDPLGQPWAYTGRFSDEETGLYYYRARHYSPPTGRFMQKDPRGVFEGPNLYEYVVSSPMNYTDPRGLGIDSGMAGGSFPGVDTSDPMPEYPDGNGYGGSEALARWEAWCARSRAKWKPAYCAKKTCESEKKIFVGGGHGGVEYMTGAVPHERRSARKKAKAQADRQCKDQGCKKCVGDWVESESRPTGSEPTIFDMWVYYKGQCKW